MNKRVKQSKIFTAKSEKVITSTVKGIKSKIYKKTIKMPSAMEILSEEGFNEKTSPIVSDIRFLYSSLLMRIDLGVNNNLVEKRLFTY